MVEAPVKAVRPKRLEKPNHKEFEAEMKKFREEKKGLHERIKEIKTSLETGRADAKIAKFKREEIEHRFEEQLMIKRQLWDEVNNVSKSHRDASNELRGKLPPGKVEQEIQKLESKQQSTSLSLKEEREVLQKIRTYKEGAKEYAQKQEQLAKFEQERKDLRQKIEEADKVLNEFKGQKGALRETKSTVNFSALNEEKNAAYERTLEIAKVLKELETDYYAKLDSYHQAEQDHKKKQAAFQMEEKQRKHEDWVQRQKKKVEHAIANYQDSHIDEVLTCNQLVGYLEKFLAPAAGEEAASIKAEVKVPEGCTILKPKSHNSEEVFYFGGKKAKSKGDKAPQAKAFKLPSNLLICCFNIQVEPPTSAEGIASCLEVVKAKKAKYVEAQEKDRDAFMKSVLEPAPAVPATQDIASASEEEAEASTSAPGEPESAPQEESEDSTSTPGESSETSGETSEASDSTRGETPEASETSEDASVSAVKAESSEEEATSVVSAPEAPVPEAPEAVSAPEAEASPAPEDTPKNEEL